ncbi:hypothetical protein [Herbiconiux sp. UC225_62]|uniref:hypothetical protein n=1 Tax=Herbiconiux sp. UC225_62 TaxID=3350168 RepID=UPI0036D3D252
MSAALPSAVPPAVERSSFDDLKARLARRRPVRVASALPDEAGVDLQVLDGLLQY